MVACASESLRPRVEDEDEDEGDRDLVAVVYAAELLGAPAAVWAPRVLFLTRLPRPAS
jgi:hypothetical protein